VRKSISPPLLITKTPTGREWCLRRGAVLVGIKSPTLPTVTLDSTTVAHRVRRWDGVLFIHILCSGYTLNRFHVADGFEWFIQWHQQGVLRGIRNHLGATFFTTLQYPDNIMHLDGCLVAATGGLEHSDVLSNLTTRRPRWNWQLMSGSLSCSFNAGLDSAGITLLTNGGDGLFGSCPG